MNLFTLSMENRKEKSQKLIRKNVFNHQIITERIQDFVSRFKFHLNVVVTVKMSAKKRRRNCFEEKFVFVENVEKSKSSFKRKLPTFQYQRSDSNNLRIFVYKSVHSSQFAICFFTSASSNRNLAFFCLYNAYVSSIKFRSDFSIFRPLISSKLCSNSLILLLNCFFSSRTVSKCEYNSRTVIE